MKQQHAASAPMPASLARRLDEIGDRFESAWRADQRPQIEQYLHEFPDVNQTELLRELVRLDIDCRCQIGETPRPEEYAARFRELEPNWLADVIAAAREAATSRPSRVANNSSVESMAPVASAPASDQQAAPRETLRCPHCHAPIGLGYERFDEVLCTSCGSSFRVRDTRRDTTTAQARQMGKFLCLERVGIGGFGAVWRARDTQLDRIVALKIPHASLLATPAERERFWREARVAAQLKHPGFVTVHEIVELDGLPSIVSDFVDGLTLRELQQVRKLTFREAAELIAEIAEALHYAHTMGVVHRDIKPANILIEIPRGEGIGVSFDSASAAGTHHSSTVNDPVSRPRPMLCDFGLALRTDADVTMTVEGQIVGTIAYMSPEQAAGASHRVDGRGDVYSLGVVLYELLSGELPFRGTNPMMLYQVRHEEPRAPRRINDRIPRDLETICLKAMGKSPSYRYATAREFAADLRRWLSGEPIQARPVGSTERLWRWSRRHPALAAMSIAVLLLSLTVTIGSAIAAFTIARARDAAARNAADAERHRDLAVELLTKQVVDFAQRLKEIPNSGELRRSVLESALQDLQRLAKDFESSNRAQRIEGVAYTQTADLELMLGKPANAIEWYQRGYEVFQRLSETSPADSGAKRDLAISQRKLGQVNQLLGKAAAARDYLERSLSLHETLLAASPGSTQATHDVATVYDHLGDLAQSQGSLQEARQHFEESTVLIDSLVNHAPSHTPLRSDLATLHQKLGYIDILLKEHQRADDVLQKSLELANQVVAEQPNSAKSKRDLSISHESMARLRFELGETEAAIDHLRKVIELRQSAAQLDPANVQAKRDLAASYSNLGRVLRNLDPVQAKTHLDHALELFQVIADADLRNTQAQNDLINAHLLLAETAERLDDNRGAREHQQKALDLAESLANALPDDNRLQADVAGHYVNFGNLAMREYDVEAAKWFERGIDRLESLQGAGRLNARPEIDRLTDQRERLAECHAKSCAIDDLQFALDQPPDQAAELLVVRGTVLARRGQHAAAAETADKLRALSAPNPTNLHNAACIYSLCAGVVAQDEQNPTTPKQPSTSTYADRAIEALRTAIDAGFKDFEAVRKDQDFQAIRSTESYKRLLENQ